MFIKLGTAFLFLLISSTASADEYTYLIHTRSDTGELIQGAAFTDSDQWEVDGYVMLERDSDSRTRFTGMWTRFGTIEAVDSYGKMYTFDVIRVLNDMQALELTNNF